MLLVSKGLPGPDMVKVRFKPGPGPGIGVQHPSLATINELRTEAKCLRS